MEAVIKRITIDRSTGKRLNEEIIGFEEVEEDTFYRPLVEILGNRVLHAIQAEQKGA